MTDQVETSATPEATPPQQPAAQFTVEQVLTIKSSLKNSLIQAYNTFISSVKQMPSHPHCLTAAMNNFDTGILWLREGIEALPMNSFMPVSDEAQESMAEQTAAPAENEDAA